MTIFQESDGAWSIRRVLALLFFILASVAGIYSVLVGADWKVVGIAFGVPITAVLVLVFFTTWETVATVIKAVKGDKE